MAEGLTHAARAAGDDPPSVAGHPAIAFRRGREVAAMSIGPLDDETVEKYREAGEVLRTVLDESAEMVEPGVTHLEVAEHAEARIRELADGCAFPVNISINEEASHASPGRDDDTVFGEDMVCLDVGVHVDGYIADSAVTVDLSGNDELVESAEEALDAALDMVEAGAHTGKIGAEIEDVIRGYGYTPVLNLSGHGVEQWDAHTDPTIPNRGAERGVELEVGDVVAIEPFATDGTGKVTEGSKNEIYSLVNDRSVRDRMSRKLLDEVREEYKLLPFAARWFEGGRSEMAIRRLEQQGILRGYPVLKEEDGAMVGQAEDTIIVTEDGYENLTR
ncbi:methionine aminopeptidase [Haloferax volcanii JCM 10717]|nr:methionine aminopeptidase [Haloferax alexandrinus JCM 10717]